MKSNQFYQIFNRKSKSGIAKRVASNFSWSIVSEVGGKSLFFFVTIYLARVLGTENYGIFTFAQTIVMYFWLAVDLGINMYGAREIAKNKEQSFKVINPLLTLRITCGCIIFSIFSFLVCFLVDSSLETKVFLGCGIYLIGRAINLDWAFRGMEKFEYIAIGNFSIFGTMSLLMVFLVHNENDLVLSSLLWSSSYFVGGGALIVICAIKFKNCFKLDFNLGKWLVHLRESIHFTFAGGLTFLYLNLPIIIIGFISSKHNLGLISACFRFIHAIFFILSVVSMSLYPVFSDLAKNKKDQFDSLFRYYIKGSFLLGIFICLAIFLFSEKIILLVFGLKYVEASEVFKVFGFFVLLVCVRIVYNTVFSAINLQRQYALSMLISIIIFPLYFLILNYLKVEHLINIGYSLTATELSILIILKIIWDKSTAYKKSKKAI